MLAVTLGDRMRIDAADGQMMEAARQGFRQVCRRVGSGEMNRQAFKVQAWFIVGGCRSGPGEVIEDRFSQDGAAEVAGCRGKEHSCLGGCCQQRKEVYKFPLFYQYKNDVTKRR